MTEITKEIEVQLISMTLQAENDGVKHHTIAERGDTISSYDVVVKEILASGEVDFIYDKEYPGTDEGYAQASEQAGKFALIHDVVVEELGG